MSSPSKRSGHRVQGSPLPPTAQVIQLVLRRRNPDRDRRAIMHFALDSERAVVQLHDMLDDRQAKPGAAQLARARAIDAIESLRQPRDIRRRNSLAGIDD